MIPDGAREGNLLGITFDPQHIPDILENGNVVLSGDYVREAQTIHPEDEIARYEGRKRCACDHEPEFPRR